MRTTWLSFLTLAACSGSSSGGASVTLDPAQGWHGSTEVFVHAPDGTMRSGTPITTSVDVDLDDGDTVTVAFRQDGATALLSLLGVSRGDAIELAIPQPPVTEPVTATVTLPAVTGATHWGVSAPDEIVTGAIGSPATIELPPGRTTVPILASIESDVAVLEIAGDASAPISGSTPTIDLTGKQVATQAVTIDVAGVAAGFSAEPFGDVLFGPDAVAIDVAATPGTPSTVPIGLGDGVELAAEALDNSFTTVYTAGTVVGAAPPDHVSLDLSVPLVAKASALSNAADHISWKLDGGGAYTAVTADLAASDASSDAWSFSAPPGTTSITLPVMPAEYHLPAFDRLDVTTYQRSDAPSYRDTFGPLPMTAGVSFQELSASILPAQQGATRVVRGKLGPRGRFADLR